MAPCDRAANEGSCENAPDVRFPGLQVGDAIEWGASPRVPRHSQGDVAEGPDQVTLDVRPTRLARFHFAGNPSLRRLEDHFAGRRRRGTRLAGVGRGRRRRRHRAQFPTRSVTVARRAVERATLMIDTVAHGAAGKRAHRTTEQGAPERVGAATVVANDRTGERAECAPGNGALLSIWADAHTAAKQRRVGDRGNENGTSIHNRDALRLRWGLGKKTGRSPPMAVIRVISKSEPQGERGIPIVREIGRAHV